MRYLETHIEVDDVDRALEFYSRLLPHRRISRWADGAVAVLVFSDGSAFGLWKKGTHGLFDGRAGRHMHFAFQVSEEEFEEFKAKLQEMGQETFEHRWPRGGKSIYFFDADGNQGEFMTVDWFGI